MEKINRLRRFLIHLYGEQKGKKRCGNLMRGSSLKVLIFKFGYENGVKRYNELREIDKVKNTLDGFIKRYGQEEGTKRYYDKNSRLSVSVNSLKSNGYSDDEIIKIRTKHRDNSKTDLNSMIHKYGFDNGVKKHKNKMEKHYNPFKYESVMKHHNISEEEAKNIVSKRQIRDLNFFIKKYGEKDGREKFNNINLTRAFKNTKQYYIEKYGQILGLEKYKDVCYKKGNGGRLDYFIEKYGEAEGKIKYQEILKSKLSNFPDFSSNIELEFNQSIYNLISDDIKEKFHGSPITKPFYINVDYDKYGTYCVVPDIKICNIIIEFDGDYWHSLPNTIIRDELKNKIYNDNNLIVKRVKEAEYISNKNNVLENIIVFINKNLKK